MSGADNEQQGQESPETEKSELTFRSASANELKDLPQPLRLHPAVLDEWSDAIATGKMKMILTYAGDQAVGRVNLIFRGPREQEVVDELGGPIVWMEAMWTNEDQRRKGIGEALALEFEREAASASDRVGLAVDPENVEAVNLYIKLGYKHQLVGGKETFTRAPFFEGDPPMQR